MLSSLYTTPHFNNPAVKKKICTGANIHLWERPREINAGDYTDTTLRYGYRLRLHTEVQLDWKKKKRSNDLKYHLPPLLSWNRLASIRPADRTQTELLPSPIRYNSRPEHWAKETGGEVEKLKTFNYSTSTCFHEGYLNNFLLTTIRKGKTIPHGFFWALRSWSERYAKILRYTTSIGYTYSLYRI